MEKAKDQSNQETYFGNYEDRLKFCSWSQLTSPLAGNFLDYMKHKVSSVEIIG
jgi:hypothetical protein